MAFVTLLCVRCRRFHGSVPAVQEALIPANFSSLMAANTNFQQEIEPSKRKLMSAREAMDLTKSRYKETLEYLA